MSHDESTSADRGRLTPLADILEHQAVQPMPADVRERIRAHVLPVPGVSVLRDTRLAFARAAAVFACGATLMSGVSFAAARALPGDPLYPLKRAAQEMRVVFTAADLQDEALIELSDTRAEEVRLLMLQQADEMRVQRAVDGFEDAAGRAVHSSPDTATAQQRVRQIEDAVSDEPTKVQERVKTGIPQACPGDTGTGGAGSGGGSPGPGSDGTGGGAGPADGSGSGDTSTGPSDTRDPGTGGATQDGAGVNSKPDGGTAPVTPGRP